MQTCEYPITFFVCILFFFADIEFQTTTTFCLFYYIFIPFCDSIYTKYQFFIIYHFLSSYVRNISICAFIILSSAEQIRIYICIGINKYKIYYCCRRLLSTTLVSVKEVFFKCGYDSHLTLIKLKKFALFF